MTHTNGLDYEDEEEHSTLDELTTEEYENDVASPSLLLHKEQEQEEEEEDEDEDGHEQEEDDLETHELFIRTMMAAPQARYEPKFLKYISTLFQEYFWVQNIKSQEYIKDTICEIVHENLI